MGKTTNALSNNPEFMLLYGKKRTIILSKIGQFIEFEK